MHPSGPFSIPAIRDFVPEKLKPWIIVFFVIVFQLSGGVYLAAISEISGSLALMQEDIMMAGYASTTGMALTFAVMFRLKFRFTSKTALLTCGAVIILCNLICIHTRSVPVLIAVCFIAGFFRMWATFECNSTIQLWLTPKRDMAVFFCYIYLLVQACIQLSGLAVVYVSRIAEWQYMHWTAVALLGTVMLLTVILFRTRRTLHKLPLYGIDWLGAIMWGITVLCIVFICVYGEYYDWFDSVHIRAAAAGGLAILSLNLWRASFIRHPFIAIKSFTFSPVYITFFLYLLADLLLAPSHIFEHIYMEAVLGYDSLNVISLNWIVLTGIIAGSLFTWLTFALRKWYYKTMTAIAFAVITGYLLLFYFIIDYDLPKEALILPMFLRSFGYVIIAVCFLTALSRVPFEYFFQTVTLQGFVSASIGGAFGTAILGYIFKIVLKKNIFLLAGNLDRVNLPAAVMPPEELYGRLQQQAMIVTMKEIYGWLALGGILCLLLFMIRESDIRPQRAIHPTYRMIRKIFRRELQNQAE